LFCIFGIHTGQNTAGSVMALIANHVTEFEKCLLSKLLGQRFSNCGPRTTSGPRVLPLWSF